MLPFKRILCPLDFSKPSYQALKAADQLALLFGAELYLVHVVAPVPLIQAPAAPTTFDVPLYQQELGDSAKKSLQEVIEQRVSPELQVRPITSYGDAADEIVRIAGEDMQTLS